MREAKGPSVAAGIGGPLGGRAAGLGGPGLHAVLGTPMDLDDAALEVLAVGLGCFWGAERLFWRLEGVRATAVGYAGGSTLHPTYEAVCTGVTGHAEVVRVAFDPARLTLEAVLAAFWESHDPTQGMRQGNDFGTQYRSCILTTTAAQLEFAERSREAYGARLKARGFAPITTTIEPLGAFYFAEDYHQQYLHKNPGGYCGLRGTGVVCG